MSNERFFRCPHCHFPHDPTATTCPVTGAPIVLPPAPSAVELPAASGPPSPKAPAAQDLSTLVGTLVGDKYHVHFILGRGGMGTVYEAEQVSVGRRVALKVLHVEDARNESTRRRFFQEAKVTASLPHTNICQVYDYGKLPDGSPYIVMERLEGESLAERLRWEGPLRIAAAVEVASQTLSALGFAHKKNVVHRDVKPENIFLAKMGRNTTVKLVDFGLSKVMRAAEPDDDATQLTKTGVAMGTPFYMAPEQAFGDKSLDGRADVWAVGVTLYECLTGKRPFAGRASFDLMRAIASEPHVPVSTLRSPLPPGLEPAVDKALQKERSDRYRSAGAFQRDLIAVLRGMAAVRAAEGDE